MTRIPDDVLAFEIGGSTIGERLRQAIEAGTVVQRDDGMIELPRREEDRQWLSVDNGPPLDCRFLNWFLFNQVYGESAVPSGCRDCYKIKVVAQNLRELVALYGIAAKIDCRSKWGIDFFNQHSANVYAGYFYLSGLDAARALYPIVRRLIDADPKLGSHVPILIKRACSNYEAAVGPSDKFTFSPELAEVESKLRRSITLAEKDSVTPHSAPQLTKHLYGSWIRFAYQLGDTTYLDFTGGRPLHRKSVTYDPATQ